MNHSRGQNQHIAKDVDKHWNRDILARLANNPLAKRRGVVAMAHLAIGVVLEQGGSEAGQSGDHEGQEGSDNADGEAVGFLELFDRDAAEGRVGCAAGPAVGGHADGGRGLES